MRDFNLNDTIAAVATPPGEGAIAMVRISGSDAVRISDGIFHGKRHLAELPSGSARYGEIRDLRGNPIDEAVVILMRNPHSYTGEDLVEICCHGGRIASAKIMQILLESGARQAERGEFTLRAFLNNRIDLTRAEAVTDLVASRSETAYEIALRQSKGKLYEILQNVIEQLREILSLVELGIDFAEEDMELAAPETIRNRIGETLKALRSLAGNFDRGRIIREGFRVAITGKVNAGKSSLLNAFLSSERAIVNEMPGTTRDTITESMNLDGIEVHLTDTAGFRGDRDLSDGSGPVEREGIRRSNEIISTSDLVLFLLDPTRPEDSEDRRVINAIGGKPKFVLLNKMDLLDRAELERHMRESSYDIDLPISALTGENLDELKAMIIGRAGIGTDMIESGMIITNRRHHRCIRESITELERVINGDSEDEIIAEHLRQALNRLGEITGETTSEDILNAIFDNFCIGK